MLSCYAWRHAELHKFTRLLAQRVLGDRSVCHFSQLSQCGVCVQSVSFVLSTATIPDIEYIVV